MPNNPVPNLSHLSGTEISKVAEALTSSKLKTLLAHRDEILAMKTEDLAKLTDFASIALKEMDNCGGFGCG